LLGGDEDLETLIRDDLPKSSPAAEVAKRLKNEGSGAVTGAPKLWNCRAGPEGLFPEASFKNLRVRADK